MEMTFIYESGRERSFTTRSQAVEECRHEAGCIHASRVGAKAKAGAQDGGLHLPGALRVCDEARESWAPLRRLEAYPVIDEALCLAGSQSERLPLGGVSS